MNVYERAENSTLRKLPKHVQNLLTDFFKTRRLSVHTRLIYIKAVKTYAESVETPLQGTCNQNLTRWYTNVTMKLEPGTILLYAVKLRMLYSFTLQQQGVDEEEAKQAAKKLFKVIPFRQLQKEADKRNELRDKLVTPEQFQQLLNATDHPRLRAFLVTSEEAGARPEELCASRIRDLQFYERYAQIRVNGKTGERTIPLINSIPYLRAWLQVHPDRKNPDSPLFAIIYKGEIKFPNRNTIIQAFHRLRQKTGMKIHAYMLRHTRLTDLADRGIGEYQLKSFAGWTVDSKMANRYVHLTGRTALKAVLEIEGISLTDREKKPEFIKTKLCPRCGSTNEADATYCQKCSLILDEGILHSMQREESQTDTLMDQLMQHPMVQKAIKDAVKELWTQGKIQKPLAIQ